MLDTFYFVMVALWMLAYVPTHQVVHSKYAQFFVRHHQRLPCIPTILTLKSGIHLLTRSCFKKTLFIFLISSSAPFLPSLCSRHTGYFLFISCKCQLLSHPMNFVLIFLICFSSLRAEIVCFLLSEASLIILSKVICIMSHFSLKYISQMEIVLYNYLLIISYLFPFAPSSLH